MPNEDISLSAEEIHHHVFERLKKYEGLNLSEKYSMFMGTAQLLELSLKNLLIRKFEYEPEKIENYSLGRVKNELDNSGLREDFIKLLESVVEYRNYIAHEFLADEAILSELLNGETGRLNIKHFEHGVFELEQLLFLYQWTEENGGWN